MSIIRTIHKSKYSKTKHRFPAEHFKPHGGGISVFDATCALVNSGSICQHIKEYYLSTVGDPIFFWKIEESWFSQVEGFANATLVNSTSDQGDTCHQDITNTQQSVSTQTPEGKRNQHSLFADKFCLHPHLFVCLDDNTCQRITDVMYEKLEKYFDL